MFLILQFNFQSFFFTCLKEIRTFVNVSLAGKALFASFTVQPVTCVRELVTAVCFINELVDVSQQTITSRTALEELM